MKKNNPCRFYTKFTFGSMILLILSGTFLEKERNDKSGKK